MDSSYVRFDRGLFSDEVVIRAAHRYTGQYHVAVHTDGHELVVQLTPLDGRLVDAGVPAMLGNAVLDEQLRQLVREETHELQQQLIAVALREANPRPSDAGV